MEPPSGEQTWPSATQWGFALAIAGVGIPVLALMGGWCGLAILSPICFLVGIGCGVIACDTALGKVALALNVLGLIVSGVLYFAATSLITSIRF